MRNNASLSLDIKSHTDLRGSIPYNKTLSQNRALSAKDYLLKKGIENDRISYSWYGEVLPLNNCEKCNEVLQQKNRRSVLYLKGFERNIGTNFKFGSDSLDKEQLLERIKNFMLLEGSASAAKPSAGASYYTVLTGSVAKNAADNYSYLRGLNVNLFEQTDSRGNRFYFFGVFSTEKEAELKLGHIKSLGFKNARVMKLEQ